jgi:hypothetical protein
MEHLLGAQISRAFRTEIATSDAKYQVLGEPAGNEIRVYLAKYVIVSGNYMCL